MFIRFKDNSLWRTSYFCPNSWSCMGEIHCGNWWKICHCGLISCWLVL